VKSKKIFPAVYNVVDPANGESVRGNICASSMGTSMASWLRIGNERMRVIANEGGVESMED
jgi:hypothetical protein